jgi:predicted ATP-grasp superfamily ATP-dependent carboligase
MVAPRVPATLANVDTSTPVVVLKFDPNVLHHGGLGVIRTMGRLGVPVFGVHEGPLAPAACSRYLRGRWYWQPSAEDTERVHAGLRRLAEQVGQPAVLIVSDDAGAIFLAEHGDALRQWFLFPSPPSHLPRQLAGKYSMYSLCQELGVPCPRAVVPTSMDEARAFAADSGFPVVAKLTSPWRDGKAGSARSTVIARDLRELEELYALDKRRHAQRMLQEYVPGGDDADWFFHGYCDSSSRCHPGFTGVKQRSYPAHAGLTSLGVSAENDRLRAQANDLLGRIGYRGILDLDIRYDARDDQYKLLDFNPRLGAQFRLFCNTAGVDVAIAQYLDATGAPIPEGEQMSGRRFVVENYDPISALSYWRHHELDIRSWVASLRSVDEVAWFATDDLRPFGLMCLWMAWRLATRPLARIARWDRRRESNPGRRRSSRSIWPSQGPGPAVATAHQSLRSKICLRVNCLGESLRRYGGSQRDSCEPRFAAGRAAAGGAGARPGLLRGSWRSLRPGPKKAVSMTGTAR